MAEDITDPQHQDSGSSFADNVLSSYARNKPSYDPFGRPIFSPNAPKWADLKAAADGMKKLSNPEQGTPNPKPAYAGTEPDAPAPDADNAELRRLRHQFPRQARETEREYDARIDKIKDAFAAADKLDGQPFGGTSALVDVLDDVLKASGKKPVTRPTDKELSEQPSKILEALTGKSKPKTDPLAAIISRHTGLSDKDAKSALLTLALVASIAFVPVEFYLRTRSVKDSWNTFLVPAAGVNTIDNKQAAGIGSLVTALMTGLSFNMEQYKKDGKVDRATVWSYRLSLALTRFAIIRACASYRKKAGRDA